jgi:spermidine/putrescine transport system substrate-binding protein
VATSAAAQDNVVQLYNWGNYTSPQLIEKFKAETGIEVKITDYDSNDTALAKIKAGGHGFDIVVPSANFVPVFVQEGLVQELDLSKLPNHKNIEPRWMDVSYDQGRKFSVPWLWGVTGVTVNTSIYKGDINTWGMVLNPPDELKGKINIIPEMQDVLHATIFYHGGKPCESDREILRKVRDTLVAAKPHWLSMDYGNIEKYSKVDIAAGSNWNGASMRSRLQNGDVKFGFPKEGHILWMDQAMILKDAKNVEGATKFINFILDPANAAMNADFAKYAAGVTGAMDLVGADMKGAPELTLPPADASPGHFILACPAETNQIYARIWTEITK